VIDLVKLDVEGKIIDFAVLARPPKRRDCAEGDYDDEGSTSIGNFEGKATLVLSLQLKSRCWAKICRVESKFNSTPTQALERRYRLRCCT
jgi:hypothetical protein